MSLSVSSARFIWLSVYIAPCSHRHTLLLLFITRDRSWSWKEMHVTVFTLVYSEQVASNWDEPDTAWIVPSGKTHRGKQGMFSSDAWWNGMTNNLSHERQCEVKRCIMNFETLSFLEYFSSEFKSCQPDYVVFERRNKHVPPLTSKEFN